MSTRIDTILESVKSYLESSSGSIPDTSPHSILEMSIVLSELHKHKEELESQHDELVRARESAEKSSLKYKALYDNAPIGYLTLDSYGKIVETNPKSIELLSCKSATDIIGRKFTLYLAEDSRVGFNHCFSLKDHSSANLFIRGDCLTTKVVKVQMYWVDSQCILSLTDLSELHQVQSLALYDPLTNLANKRLLEDRLLQALSYSSRTKSYLAVIVMDLDNFKPINDTYGHLAGDYVLKDLSLRLQHQIRESDTIARFGGDEFVAVLSLTIDKAQSIEYAKNVAEKIRAALELPVALSANVGSSTISCTASIGVCVEQNHDNTSEDLISMADKAMYTSKKLGGNIVSVYTPKRKRALHSQGELKC